MGQYYTPLIKRNDEYTAYDTGLGYKLTEQSWVGGIPDKLAALLYKNPAEFAWVGDYANENEWEKSFHSHAHGADINEISLDSFNSLDITDKYIVNHTKHEYIDMKAYMDKVENDSWGQMHPLSLMTAIGNGRGNGDYISPINEDKVGAWAGDIISIEDEAPQGFKQLDVWFSMDEQLIEKWGQIKRSSSMYINEIIEAAKEIDEMGAESLAVTEFGDLNVTIKITKDVTDESNESASYNIEIYAPQTKGKLLSENKRWLGYESGIEESSLSAALFDVEDGSFKFTSDNIKGKPSTLKETMSHWNKKRSEIQKG